MIFRPVEAARTKLFLYKFALKGFFFCYLKEEQTPANLSTSVFSYFNISPFLLFSKLFYFLESQFRNLLHPFRSRLLVFPSHYSATAVVLFIDLWIDPPPTTSTSLLSFPLPFVFHAFPFAPIPVSSSFTAKSRRYSPLLPPSCLQRWILSSQSSSRKFLSADRWTPTWIFHLKVARASWFSSGNELSFSVSRLNLVRVCQGKHVYRSRGRFH